MCEHMSLMLCAYNVYTIIFNRKYDCHETLVAEPVSLIPSETISRRNQFTQQAATGGF